MYPLDHYPPFFGYYFFNVMLMVLQLLHIYWAFLISRMVYKFIFTTVRVSKRSCVYKSEEAGTYLWFTVSHCGSPVICSWKVMTGVMKRRRTVTRPVTKDGVT